VFLLTTPPTPHRVFRDAAHPIHLSILPVQQRALVATAIPYPAMQKIIMQE